MSSSRAPWWMYIIAASFLGLFVLRIYVLSPFYSVPGPLGFFPDDRSSSVIVERVGPGSIAERAGLRAGDRIVSANGLTIRSYINWDMAAVTFEVGQPLRLDVEREGRRIELSMIPEKRSRTVFRSPYVSLLAGTDLLTLVIACHCLSPAARLCGPDRRLVPSDSSNVYVSTGSRYCGGMAASARTARCSPVECLCQWQRISCHLFHFLCNFSSTPVPSAVDLGVGLGPIAPRDGRVPSRELRACLPPTSVRHTRTLLERPSLVCCLWLLRSRWVDCPSHELPPAERPQRAAARARSGGWLSGGLGGGGDVPRFHRQGWGASHCGLFQHTARIHGAVVIPGIPFVVCLRDLTAPRI